MTRDEYIVETEAKIIAAMLQQRSDSGISQRKLARLCDIPHSTAARKVMPKLDTLVKILHGLGLTLIVTPLTVSA